jgi:hypothetical protein
VQQRLMVRHFGTILQAQELEAYKVKLIKALFSLCGSLVVAPYIAYNFLTIKRNPAVKTRRIWYGIGLQMVFTIFNVRWSRQYRQYDLEM